MHFPWPKLSTPRTPTPAAALITTHLTTDNAAPGSPQLGLFAPLAISNTLAHPRRSTKCRHTSALLHMRPRHQINVWPQTRPFRTQPQQARIEQHIYRRSRAESAFDPPAYWLARPQARHDSDLRPGDGEAHALHRSAG